MLSSVTLYGAAIVSCVSDEDSVPRNLRIAKPVRYLISVHFWHAEINEHNVWKEAARFSNALLTAMG